jgi:predicted ribosome quality control (RQC) complex YloA/Tae2 family protein
MPYDAGAAYAVCFELNNSIAGGRIEKIFQPAKDHVVLHIYARGERYKLALDAGAGSPKVYLTNHAAENLPMPPPFYNVLRKYLMNARVNSVSLVEFDRVFEIKLDANDEMGFARPLYLYAECIRKQSNIVLCDENKKIIAAAKTVDLSMSEMRQILPGLLYEPPASDKINPMVLSKQDFLSDLESADPDLQVCEYLLAKYQGFSPLITREIALRAGKSTDVLTGGINGVDKSNLSYYFFELIEKIKNNQFAPVMIYTSEKLIDFSYTDIRQYGNSATVKSFGNMSELVDYFFYRKEFDNRIRQKSNDIFKILTNASSRLVKKIKNLERDLLECENKEKFKIYGDLITANIYRLEKGAEIYELENFYADSEDTQNNENIEDNENNRNVKITVEKNLTPAQNAQKLYKRYNKFKSGEYHLSKQIESAKDDIVYVDSVFDALTRALSERELAEIRDELAEAGLTRSRANTNGKSSKNKKPQKTLPVSKPEEYQSPNGFKILCGRNNKQNDNLTFRLAGKNDIWFHAQKIPGSHVILMCENTGRTPENTDIEQAAKIAAANSKGKNMPLVSVDYAPARYVKKPPGAKPGFVTYANFKTAAVKPANPEQ